jgi:Ni,Fe-hydrogenase III large subunit/Ni,Fe-hydrogenase III component G
MDIQKIQNTYLPSGTFPKKEGNLLVFSQNENELKETIHRLYGKEGLRLKTISCVDMLRDSGVFRIYYIFALPAEALAKAGVPEENVFLAPYFETKKEFPSFTPDFQEFSAYEREIKTMFGLEPVGHPDPRPTVLHANWPKDKYPLRKDFPWNERPKTAEGKPYRFNTVEGEGVYEIPVGPVHAGIIEPGHFRFSVLGEEVLLLDPLLGYVHKGSEKLFEHLPLDKKIKLSERISGDSSFAHSLAFCQALESLSDSIVPEKHQLLRVVFAELERIANHFNDIGFIMLDTAFSFGGANGARLREKIMHWNERITGSRFLRGVNVIGGVTRDIPIEKKTMLLSDIPKIFKDFNEMIAIAEQSHSLHNRLTGTGFLSNEIIRDFGVIGIPARASGIKIDARRDHPYAAYDKLQFSISTRETSDVHARLKIRVLEVFESFRLIEEALRKLENGESQRLPEIKKDASFRKNSFAVSVVEGWRGDIVYFVATDMNGEITRVKVRDTSFLNWQAFPTTVKGEMVPDFPLINKSFNLSYSGHDL